MINFDEEVKKFQPCLEMAQAENLIYKNDVKDITDVLAEMMEQLNKQEK